MLRCFLVLLGVSVSITAQNIPTFRWIQQIDGSGVDSVVGIGTDANGNVYVAGNTASLDFPVKSAIQNRSASAGLYRVDGNGAGYTPLALGAARAIAIDQVNNNIIYAASGANLLKSVDGGSTWSALPITAPSFQTIAIDPTNHTTLYAGTTTTGALKSTDSGASWTPINTGLQTLTSFPTQIVALQFWIDPNNPNVVFTDASSGFQFNGYRSGDGGKTWTIDPTLQSLQSIWFDLTTPNLVYATTSSAALKSTDDGKTWTTLAVSPKALTQNAVGFASITSDPNRPGRLIVATSRQLFESLDDGATFAQTVTLLPLDGALKFTPDWSNGVFYAQAGSIVRVSADLKSVVNLGPALPQVNQIAVANGRVYAAIDASKDVFVTKFDALGNIVWSTFFGGTGDDTAKAMAVDSAGNVYVTGSTTSADFPATKGAFAAATPKAGANVSFVFKLTSLGAVGYSTYFSDGSSTPTWITVDAAGEAIITGTSQGNLPTTAGSYQPVFSGNTSCFLARPDAEIHPNLCIFPLDGFVTKFDAGGASLVFSTYLGVGSAIGSLNASVAAAGDGSVFVANASGLFHLNASGSTVLSSGNLSGSVSAMTVGNDGNVYIAGGVANPSQFPTTPGALLAAPLPFPVMPGSSFAAAYAFVTKFSPDFKQILASTLLGGGYVVQPKSIAIDSVGNVLVGGSTTQFGFPTVAPLANGFSSSTGFAAILKPDLSALLFSTYLGDAEIFGVQGVAFSPDGDFVIAGSTGDLPSNSGPFHVFLNKIAIAHPALRIDGVLNAASLLNTPLSAGETIVVRGAGFGADAQILINGIAVKPIAVDSQNLTAVVPATVTAAAVLVQVQSGGATSNYVAVPVTAAGPGLFSADGSGYGQGIILNADGSRNSTANPAKIGDAITIFATGIGPISFDGPFAVAQLASATFIDGFYASGVAAVSGPVAGLPGNVYQLTIIVPDPVKANPDLKNFKYPPLVPIVLQSNGVRSQPDLALAIAQ